MINFPLPADDVIICCCNFVPGPMPPEENDAGANKLLFCASVEDDG